MFGQLVNWPRPVVSARKRSRFIPPLFLLLSLQLALSLSTEASAHHALRQALPNPLRKDAQPLAQTVDARVMQPVRSLLGDATQLLISPDGALNLVPFEALIDEQGSYLVQRYSFSKQLVAPRILHIATHGFFLEDPGTAVDGKAQPASRRASASAQVENPLLRSGLALTGANLRRGGLSDDGILTALEASGLNLWGPKLVVLSACDTGLGEVRNDEGVYGLRRAFVQAGAESLVMSLWPVGDYSTRNLMISYYKNLRLGLGRGAALRQVQLDLLKRNRHLHPFYWANFIQSGEWANLDGRR
jgi:CHAT domain-containing protein